VIPKFLFLEEDTEASENLPRELEDSSTASSQEKAWITLARIWSSSVEVDSQSGGEVLRYPSQSVMRECGLWPTANSSTPNKKRDETSVTRSIEDGDATEEYYSVPWHYESGVFLQLEGTDQE
jgi:hypothetical protein